MSEPQLPPIEFGSPTHAEGTNALFLKTGKLLERLNLDALPEKTRACAPLIRGILHDVEAIALLNNNRLGNEAYMVLRGLSEKIVTFFYLQAAGDEEFQAYFQYSIHKTYRLMERVVSAEGEGSSVEIRFAGEKPDLSSLPEWKAAVDRFTSKGGKPLTRWSNSSIDGKLVAIREAKLINTFALDLLVATTYDDSSEALHATLYGCLFHLGAYHPGTARTVEGVGTQYRVQLITALSLAMNALHDLNTFLFSATNQDDLLAESRSFVEIANAYTKYALEHKETPSKS